MKHVVDFKRFSINETESQEDLDRYEKEDLDWEMTFAIKNNPINMFHSESEKKTLEKVKDLLDRGADVNVRSSTASTPLHNAAMHGYAKVAKFLLDKGAEVDLEDNRGKTPLHVAARERHRTVARILIQGGADPFTVFKSAAEILSFFDGDIDWMPEGPLKEDLKAKLKRMQRGKSAFGM